jgi:poly-gamma-glutamate capsule biosynthesis protein CapA/YwtB (metallophosphatase superfamily)
MRHQLVLTGDVNLMKVSDPRAPFKHVAPVLRAADLVFGNLECCLYAPGGERSVTDEGFYSAPAMGEALTIAGYHVLGTANNVNYGPDAIPASLKALDALGLAHTGSGVDHAAAHAPALIERKGLRYGFVQRTSVYWPTNHEAGEHSPGVAVIRGNTAYQVPAHKTRPEIPPMNRPGIPPIIKTWAEPSYLARYREELAALRGQVDILVSSHHWGLHQEVLEYMTEIAHAAIDAGADLVIGHGPHFLLPIEVYKGKPIFYGMGNFSFHTGHGNRKHGDWVGLMAGIELEDRAIRRVAVRFVRHNERNETLLKSPVEEPDALRDLVDRSKPFGTLLTVAGDEVVVSLK